MTKIFQQTDLKILLSILFTLAFLSGVGYYFIDKTSIIGIAYLAILYMPIPLYTLLILSAYKKENLVSRYFKFRSIKFKDVLFTLSVFFTWATILAILTITLSSLFPAIFGELMRETSQLINYLKTIAPSEDLSNLNNLPSPLLLFPVGVFSAIIAGLTINGLFAFTEEILWRGYLYDKFETESSNYRNIAIGTIWGLWHIPLIIQGYNYGSTINPIFASFAFVIVCISLTYLLNLIRENTNSTILCAVFHGAFNGLAGIFTLLIMNYNPLISGQIGLVSILSIFITYFLFHKSKQ